MIRFLFRLVLLGVLLIGGVVFYYTYDWNRGSETAIGSPGSGIDTDRARRAAAGIAERVAAGASQAEKALAETRLTAKIKSKIALDDTIDGNVNVDTTGTIVTLTGRVATPAQRKRVLALAQETDGVTRVVDEMEIQQ